jgi:hypothetical protein
MPSDLSRPNRCCATFNASWFPWLDLCRVNQEAEHQLIGSPLEALDTVPARLTLEIWETRRSGAAVHQRISRLRTTILQPMTQPIVLRTQRRRGLPSRVHAGIRRMVSFGPPPLAVLRLWRTGGESN